VGAATRLEHDSLGEVAVPAEAYWGAQTQRALLHFAIGRERMPHALIRAYALIKQAAAETNATLGELPPAPAEWIQRAAQEILDGRLGDQFPLALWQSGSGTQTNMNLNEVIANRGNELAGGARGDKAPLHPNDHVNRGQSTNDTFPSAIHVAAALALRDELLPALTGLIATLERKAEECRRVIKIGRTHLQDATPLTLGQEIGGWAAQLRQARAWVEAAQPALLQLAAGGTAVGTGLNAHPRFGDELARRVGAKTGLPFTSAPNKFAALAGCEALSALAGALATLAGALFKVANDVRWLASGPRCGLGEIQIPENEPGSSIMPGKVNPSQAEALMMVCLRVLGNHGAVAFAASQGNFELNVCRPLIAQAVLDSIELLASACLSFERFCVRGLEPKRGALAANVERSLMLVTALAPHIGYDAAARIANRAHADGTSLREAALALGLVSAEQFDAWVSPSAMLGPDGEA
jgi:fumarate hydratase class II